jgi:2-alkyl-3-oxoalkanoate reductase
LVRILVAGATGAVGKHLVPALLGRGYEVVGTTRTPSKTGALETAGARAIVLDVLDHDAVMRAARDMRPDVIVHEATAIPGALDMRKFAQAFAPTNRLRTDGTRNLIAAARSCGARIVAQSFAGWPYAREGGPVKSEDDPLDPHPPAALRSTLDALRTLESAVLEAHGTVLRYGAFYGPDTSLTLGGAHVELIRQRQFPIVGPGTGIWSFAHIADVADATAHAIAQGATGIYNITDDEPAPVAEWLPYLAQLAGAKPPLRLPRWIGRLMAGDHVVALMNDIRGASNAKAKQRLGWRPKYTSWREGFRVALAEPSGLRSRTAGADGLT